jgi:hypothetical protein
MLKSPLTFTAALALLALAFAAQAEAPKGWMLAGSEPAKYDTGLEARGSGKVAFIRGRPGEATTAGFGTLMQSANASPYLGKRLRLSASLKAEGADAAQMWMRVDGRTGPLTFDNMDSRPLTRTTEWKRYEIVLDVPAEATNVAFGFFLKGQGKVSADDFRLDIVGRDVPVTGRALTPQNLSFEESRLNEGPAEG